MHKEKYFLWVACKTKEEVENLRQKYIEKRGMKLTLAHCVFQKKHHFQKNKVKNTGIFCSLS